MRITCFVFVCVSLDFISIPAEPTGTDSDENDQERETNFEIPRDQDTKYDDPVIYEVPRVQVEDEPSKEYDENGDESSEKDHYTFVALIDIMFTDGCKRTCTGSIIHDNVVITAAHCFTMVQRKFMQPELSLSFVVIGTRRMFETGYEQYLPIEKVITHPRFKEWTADLALVFTFANMYSDKPAEILPLALEKSSVPVDSNVTVFSWGKCTSDIEIDSQALRQKQLHLDQVNQPDNTDDINEEPTNAKDSKNSLNSKEMRKRIYHRNGNDQLFSEDNDEVRDLTLSLKTLEKSVKTALSSINQAPIDTPDPFKNIDKDDEINNVKKIKLHDDNQDSQATKLKKNRNGDNRRQHKSGVSKQSHLLSRDDNQQQNGELQNIHKLKKNKGQTATKVRVIRKPVREVKLKLNRAQTNGARRGNNRESSILPFFDLQDYDGASFVNPTRSEINETEYMTERIQKPVENRRNVVKTKLQNIQQRKGAYSLDNSRRNAEAGKQYTYSGAEKKNQTSGVVGDQNSYAVKINGNNVTIGNQYTKIDVGKKTRSNDEFGEQYINTQNKNLRNGSAADQYTKIDNGKKIFKKDSIIKNRRNFAAREQYKAIDAGKYVRVDKKKVRRYIQSSNLADLQKYKNWRRQIGEQHNNLTAGKFTFVNVATCKKMVDRTLPPEYGLKNKHEYLCYSSEEFFITNEDSGAPVVQNGELAAVTIGGVDNEGDHIAVGIRVACFCEWIASNLPDDDGSKLKCCTNCCNNTKAHNNGSSHKEDQEPEFRSVLKRKGRLVENRNFPKYYKKRYESHNNYG